MSSFQRLSTFFEIAISRVKFTHILMWLLITIALMDFGGLLIGSLTQRDPTPIYGSLGLLPMLLLVVVTPLYHLYLMFQTINLAADDIAYEKIAQGRDTLLITKVDVRQMVRVRWWVIVKHQFPWYVLLALLRTGMTAVIAILLAGFYHTYFYNYYPTQIWLAHPVTVLFSALMGIGYTFANFGLSAAYGVMTSGVSKRSAIMVVLRAFSSQIAISVLSSLSAMWVLRQLSDFLRMHYEKGTNTAIWGITLSFVDNGFLSGLILISPPSTSIYDKVDPSVPMPLAIELIITGLLALLLYTLPIYFALWRAEKNTIRDLSTSVDKSLSNPKSLE